MLSGVCPGCGLRADLDVFCVQADANQALAAALALPAPLGGRVLRYLRLFSPPNKVLAGNKTVRLLAELADTIKSAQISRRGVAYAAPLGLWETALDTVLGQPPDVLPLNSHGYLFQVAWNLADRAVARQERAAEDRLRQRPTSPPGPLSMNGEGEDDSPFASTSLSAGAASAPSSIAPAQGEDGAAFSSPPPAERRARSAVPAEFRALLQSLGRASSPPPVPAEPANPSPPLEQ